MADYCISGVRYNPEGTHIDVVRVHTDSLTRVGDPMICDRAFVADLISREKATFQTVTKNSLGKWCNGALIHVVDQVYLATDANALEADNLSSLPRI